MNYMKLNTDKSHLLISGNRSEYMWTKLDQDIVGESNDVELLGVTIDNNLRFDKHVSKICLKANRKLLSSFLLKKRRILFKAFIDRNLNIVHLCGCFMEGESMIR